MNTPHRPPRIHHCTSEPYRFVGRTAELALLDAALAGGDASVIAFVGPGGQGKTAIVQHWLESIQLKTPLDGVFLWSFYRGKDSDVCLRELYAYAEDLAHLPEVSATYCVDHLLPRLRGERWAIVLDGTEVVQHEGGPWAGRFVHPELGRLVDELAMTAMPGVLLLTTRFTIPGLQHRRHARVFSLTTLDPPSACELMRSLGVVGEESDLEKAAAACGFHAKAVELLATLLVHFHAGDARHWRAVLGEQPDGSEDAEQKVARVLTAYHAALPQESRDLVALATAFREPPTEERLIDYLLSPALTTLLASHWRRTYPPFAQRGRARLHAQLEGLVRLRLLERVGDSNAPVIDAHPLVRRAFEHTLGVTGRRQSSLARAGFLRGRPDRRRPESLEEAREEVELFHAHCEAGLWNEADGVYVALENPKHRFLAPAFERDLLLRFFPAGNWRQPPLWPGFGRYRSLAICHELLGQFEEALEIYRGPDAPLRGDALTALGRLEPLLAQPNMPHPWQSLWQAYRAHALCLAGRVDEAVALAATLVPIDMYEWVHVFECLLRAGRLDRVDLASLRTPIAQVAQAAQVEHRWAELARRRILADFARLQGHELERLDEVYAELVKAYDRGGLAFERTLTRLSRGRLLLTCGDRRRAAEVAREALDIARRYQMSILEVDALELLPAARDEEKAMSNAARELRAKLGYRGPRRP